MNQLLQSLRSDLLDRRVLPIVVLLGLALAGALAYAVLSGASSAKPVAAASPVTPPPHGPALAVAQAPANPHAAVSETTEGGRYRHREGSHDPFRQFPAPKTLTTSTVAQPASPAPSPESKSTPASSGGAGTTPSTLAPAPKPKTVHHIVETASVLFGPAPTTPGQLSQLTPYATVKRGEPLPSADDPVVVFKSLGSDNKSALFTFTREVIPKGPATCKPSASQCESILLPLGGAEELSILEPSGQTVVYELVLEGTSRHSVTARIARHHRAHR